jgi:2-polyprenyl-3-methyl-5-hydroxy-6-metoxy-1,4-benzoquinol methylase
MIQRTNCVICLHKLIHIYSLQNVPSTLSCTNIPEFSYNELSYGVCNNCNTVQLDKLIPLHILYDKSHNFISVGETWKQYFLLFAEHIKPKILDKIVMEIGCPSGKIANLCEKYKKWYAIDPNINSNNYNDSNIIFFKQFFDENIINKTNEKIDIIIHSHLFEHIYEPNKFLNDCYNLLNNEGEMFFGIPNMEYISEKSIAPFFGVFFEHTIFYNRENITYLLHKNNFELINIHYYGNHSILFHVKKQSNCATNCLNISNVSLGVKEFNNNIDFYDKFIQKIIVEIQIIENINKRVYLFGASYNNQILLCLGLKHITINGILDNCIDKQNKYLYGYDLKIVSPSILSQEDSIVILNGIYCDEIIKQINIINPNTYVIRN